VSAFLTIDLGMRIPFAYAVRDHYLRTRSATVTTCVTMCSMDALDMEIQAAAKKRARAEQAFNAADGELRQLLVRGRAEGKGPSHMAKLTGFTREWVARIAPDLNKS
jgi:hypothetical protein